MTLSNYSKSQLARNLIYLTRAAVNNPNPSMKSERVVWWGVPKTEVFGTQQCQLCSINNHLSVISQSDTGLNRHPPAGALAIMGRYSQWQKVPLERCDNVEVFDPPLWACRPGRFADKHIVISNSEVRYSHHNRMRTARIHAEG
jgi:hypothetical protein